jgi:DNA-binding MarR family transcriptional regulator
VSSSEPPDRPEPTPTPSPGRFPEPNDITFALRDLGQAVDLHQQVAADRLGLNRTDLTLIGLLEAHGARTPGQIAEASGLTTGAVTGVVDRLEKAGLVRREPDPADRRRVLVRLLRERLGRVVEVHEPIHLALHALEAGLDAAHRAAVRDYIRRATEAFDRDARRLMAEAAAPAAGPAAEARDVLLPLAGATRGRLEFVSGAARVALAGGAPAGALLAAHFDGAIPRVAARGGEVTVAYAGFGALAWRKQAAAVALAEGLPWELELRGGVARLEGDLAGVTLRSLEVRGGASDVSLSLPRPTGTVLVRLVGGASDVRLRRPAGAEARLRVTGGAASLTFDAQRLGAVGGTVRLETPGWATAADRYDFEIGGGAAGLEVTVG